MKQSYTDLILHFHEMIGIVLNNRLFKAIKIYWNALQIGYLPQSPHMVTPDLPFSNIVLAQTSLLASAGMEDNMRCNFENGA